MRGDVTLGYAERKLFLGSILGRLGMRHLYDANLLNLLRLRSVLGRFRLRHFLHTDLIHFLWLGSVLERIVVCLFDTSRHHKCTTGLRIRRRDVG